VLPGDIGRDAGPFATSRRSMPNHEMGTDRLFSFTADRVSRFAVGDMGHSYAYRAPVAPFLMTALANSAKLALVAFVLVVPLGILGGVVAALNVGRPLDRVLTVVGLSATIVPEFVSGIVFLIAGCRSRPPGRTTPGRQPNSIISCCHRFLWCWSCSATSRGWLGPA
jgi:peptide/nickel transport system permease protein